MNDSFVSANNSLTDAQKHLINWFFQKLPFMNAAQEEEVYQLFAQIGQIRMKLDSINDNMPLM
jgi:hypothetical protein